jgi:hypothetical protein
LHGEGFPISSRSKYEGKWGKMGFSTEAQKIFIQAVQVTCMTRVTNENLHVPTTKKGSKMTKKRGSKKGQKWPKIGVQKRVKNGPKINFFEDIKTNVDKTKKIRVTTTLKLILISQTYEKQRQLTTKKTQNLSQK